MVFSHTSSKEPLTTITAFCSVVFACRSISTYQTDPCLSFTPYTKKKWGYVSYMEVTIKTKLKYLAVSTSRALLLDAIDQLVGHLQ